ncbi:UDP-glucuronosyl/UDP-glucosyltransferase [Macleaya cordata]|uniref:Glycosyltransferase n=1 Tax=Macleaya cordata TaxID=56857 RepID=A0A200PV08_MACCD|nr:UDP-glucuronosyl/UDP-glucosyltransferase [Macleaya cordata]
MANSGEEKVVEHDHHHVLLVAFSSQGHLNPMLRLGKLLASKGLHVTLATTEVARQRMLKTTTTTTITTSSNNHICLKFFSDGLPLDYDRKNNLDYYMNTISTFGPLNLSKLIDNYFFINGSKFSCNINNQFVPWVVDVAVDHGIPCAMLWIQPCAFCAIYYCFYRESNQFPTVTDPDMTIELPGLPLLQSQDLPSFVLPCNPFRSLSKMFSQLFQGIGKLRWVLANSFYELEKDVVDSMNECTLSNNTHRSTGTVYNSSKTDEERRVGSENSNHSFLWVVKPAEHALGDVAGQLPPGFVEETKNRGLMVPWCPQTKVLMHPAISCFITHCGWNSTLEAVATGFPVIGFPQWTDQPANAKLIADVFKTGLRLRLDDHHKDGVLPLVTEEEVERCIKEAMDGPKAEELKKRAAEWKETARKAVAVGGSSDQNIQLFIDEMIG